MEYSVQHNVQIYYSDKVLPFTGGVMVLKSRYGKGVKHLKVLGMPKGFTPSGYTHLVDKHQTTLIEEGALKDVLGKLNYFFKKLVTSSS